MSVTVIVYTVNNCQHQDGRRAVAAKDAADLKPIEPRQHQVQDDEVRTALEPFSVALADRHPRWVEARNVPVYDMAFMLPGPTEWGAVVVDNNNIFP